MHRSARVILDLLSQVPVMPIIWIHEAETAVGVARALVDGGVRVFEVLVRTPAALDAITAMRRHVPEATVGAGTLIAAADVQRALDAGAIIATKVADAGDHPVQVFVGDLAVEQRHIARSESRLGAAAAIHDDLQESIAPWGKLLAGCKLADGSNDFARETGEQ
jgi:hypothetical protein